MDRAKSQGKPVVDSLEPSVQRDNAAWIIPTIIAIPIGAAQIARGRVRMIQSVLMAHSALCSASMALHRTKMAVPFVSAIHRLSKTCAKIGTTNLVVTMGIVLRVTNVDRFKTAAWLAHACAMKQQA